MGLRDLDIIEVSLRQRLNELSKSSGKDHHREISEIRDVLGNLHNQKVWYRPKSSVYVGGWNKPKQISIQERAEVSARFFCFFKILFPSVKRVL